MDPNDGYKYNNNGSRNGITYFKCIKARTHFCNGSIKRLENGTFVTVKPHRGHGREQGINNQGLISNFRAVLKQRAATENIPLKNIYDEESRRHVVAAGLYPWSTAESIMRFTRRSTMPRLPNSLSDLATLFENQQLNRFGCCDAPFFRGCVRDADGRSNVIFACTNLIQHVLRNVVTEIHADATFKVVPVNMGYQLLTIHCMIQNYSIPIVYVLMESKSRNSYDCVIRFIRNNLLPNLAPETIITDYETALRDALISAFPESRAVGCFFHHNQAVWRKMKNLGYLHHINNNANALKALRLLLSLPLLPTRDINNGFLLIRAFCRNHGVHLERLLTYYERYWIRNVGPQIVSVHGLPRRTNNNIESFHNALRIKFSVTHPSLWVFLGHLTHLNQNYHIIEQQLFNNLRPTRHLRTKFLANSRRIKNATEQYDLGLISMWQFLQQCSYVSAAYEQRQRNWERMNADELAHVPIEADPLPNNVPNAVDPQPIVHIENIINPLPNRNIIGEILIELGQEEQDLQLNDIPDSPPDSPNAPQMQDGIENGNVCMICTTISLNETAEHYIVMPCGHAWVCSTCVRQLEVPNTVCPMCRTRNISFQRIYFTY